MGTTGSVSLSSKSKSKGVVVSRLLKNIPIILLTAKAMTEDRIRGYQMGADVVLPKPFSPEELLSIIDNLIERKNRRKRQNRSSRRRSSNGRRPITMIVDNDNSVNDNNNNNDN